MTMNFSEWIVLLQLYIKDPNGMCAIHPSILPFKPWKWVTESGNPRLPSPQQHTPAPLWGAKGIPRPFELCNPSSMFLVYNGASYQLDWSRVLPKEAPGRRPDQTTKQLLFFFP